MSSPAKRAAVLRYPMRDTADPAAQYALLICMAAHPEASARWSNSLRRRASALLRHLGKRDAQRAGNLLNQ